MNKVTSGPGEWLISSRFSVYFREPDNTQPFWYDCVCPALLLICGNALEKERRDNTFRNYP